MTPSKSNRGRIARQLSVGIGILILAMGVLSVIMLVGHQGRFHERQLADLLRSLSAQARNDLLTHSETDHHHIDLDQHLELIANSSQQVRDIGLFVGGQLVSHFGDETSLCEIATEAKLDDDIGPFDMRRVKGSDLHSGVLHFRYSPAPGVPSQDACVIITSPHEALRMQWMKSAQVTMLIMALTSILTAVGLYFLIRRTVTSPVTELAAVAKAIASGNVSARVPQVRENEIGEAGEAVNNLADTLTAQAETLRERERRLRTLFRGASDAWLVVDDQECKILEANDQATVLLRRPMEAIIGMPLGSLVPIEEKMDWETLPQQLAESTNIRSCDLLHVQAPNGVKIPVSLMARALRDGQQAMIFVSLRDISTAHKQRQQIEYQLKRITALNNIITTCAKSLDLQEVYRSIHTSVAKVMSCDAMAIILWDEESNVITSDYLIDTFDGKKQEINDHLRIALTSKSLLYPVIKEHRNLALDRRNVIDGTQRAVRFGDGKRQTESMLYVPMIAEGRVIGALTVQSYTIGAHSPEDLELLTAMANQAALSIQNARHHRLTKIALQTREALHRITEAIGNSMDLQEICKAVYREVEQLIPTDSFFVSMVIHDLEMSQTLYSVDTQDGKRIETEKPSPSMQLSEQFIGEVVRKERPVLELRHDSDIPTKRHHPFGDTTRRSKSLMYVPLAVRHGEVMGVISVQSYEQDIYTQETLNLLEEIADLTALALERAKLFNEVTTSEARYRALVESSNVAIILTDRDDKIALWNNGAEQIFGHATDEILGLDIGELFHENSYNSGRVDEALKRHSTWTAEVQAKHRDGTVLEVVLTVANVIDNHGKAIGRVVISSDLTEKKTLERALLQAQKMESIGTLAGGIAHDFNNLLTGILGYATYLRSQADPSTKMARDLGQIERAAKRASELTAQLLAFSRKQQMSRKAISVNQIVDETSKLMERTLGKHIRLQVDKGSDIHSIEADPTQIQQVLMNLAINARDAMSDGGTLSLKTRDQMVTEDQCRSIPEMTPGQHVVISVRDTGKGMDEETQERIFDPFFTTKPVGEGTGLGLAMVYGIVRGHGGMIEVESEPGKGTEFRIYLPRGEVVHQVTQHSQDEYEIQGGTETVMLVDDEPMILRLGCSILERYGYSVLAAPGGPAALDLFRKHQGRIDLVVLDMVMPEMNGAELTERLHELEPGLRILLSSGYTLDANAQDLIQSKGMIGFLPKPYRMSQLVHQVRQALDKPISVTHH